MPVKKGDKVKVDYIGTLDDGTEFDNSAKHGKPLEFEVGAGQVIPGFESAVMGMEKGQKKKVKILAKEAYGEHVADLIKTIPRNVLPTDKEAKPGMIIVLSTADGHRFPALIVKVETDTMEVDLNHPMAGKNLNFEITVVDF